MISTHWFEEVNNSQKLTQTSQISLTIEDQSELKTLHINIKIQNPPCEQLNCRKSDNPMISEYDDTPPSAEFQNHHDCLSLYYPQKLLHLHKMDQTKRINLYKANTNEEKNDKNYKN